MTRQPEVEKVGQLVLVRLLAGGEGGATFAQIKKDLDPLLQHRWSGGAQTELLDHALHRLVEAGDILRTRGKRSDRSALTSTGRQAALQFLGMTDLSSKTGWSKLKGCYTVVERVLPL